MTSFAVFETQDFSAIEAVEAEYEKRRAGLAAAAASAVRRAGWLRAGLGIGAAAAGIGLGALLLLWGVSLVLNRSALPAKALHEAQERVAAAERLAEEKGRVAEKAVADAQAILKKFETARPAVDGKPSKSVSDFSFFRHHELGTLEVTTGWNYAQLADAAPSHEWCYVRDKAVRDGLNLTIAVGGKPVPINPDRIARAGLTENDVRRALPLCEWFRGANPNITDAKGATP